MVSIQFRKLSSLQHSVAQLILIRKRKKEKKRGEIYFSEEECILLLFINAKLHALLACTKHVKSSFIMSNVILIFHKEEIFLWKFLTCSKYKLERVKKVT